MPAAVELEPEGACIKYLGIITLKDVLDSLHQVWGSDDYPRHRYQIVDFTECESFELSEVDMRALAAMDMASLPRGCTKHPPIRVALICTDDEILEKLQIYGDAADPEQFPARLFDTLDCGREWATEEVSEKSDAEIN